MVVAVVDMCKMVLEALVEPEGEALELIAQTMVQMD